LLRSYLPGYFPWYLTADEARFLAIALRQAIDVAKRFREEPAYLKPPGADQYLVRLFDGQHGMVWNDRWMAQLMPPAPLLHAPPIDSKRLAKIRRMPATHGVLEVGCFTMPGGVQESPGERPYLARVVVVMDADSRMMLGTDTTGPLDLPEKLQECLLSVLENIRMRPDEVRVEDESFVSVLKPIAGQLAIKLKLVDELTRVREAAAEFQRFAGMF
jgi:hypothetical protein